MKERVSAWYKKKHSLPDRTLFYRSGVGESLYGKIIEEEFPQILDGFKMAVAELSGVKASHKEPKLNLVIVTKRHSTRFYPFRAEQTTNPISGQVVDDQIVKPRNWSFYLQSHHSPNGIARSTHYVVLKNDDGWSRKALVDIVNDTLFSCLK